MNWELFDKNIAALKSKQDLLYKDLENDILEFRANPEGTSEDKILRLIDGPRQTKNLLYIRSHPPLSRPYYETDGESEAKDVLEKAGVKFPQLVLHYGIGLGYNFAAFQKIKTRSTFGQFICEKDTQIFLRALHVHDFSEAFEDRQFFWCIGKSVGFATGALVNFFEENTTVSRNLKVLVTPGALQTETDFYSEMLKAIMPSRDQATVWNGNSVSDSFTGLWNTLHNLEFLATNPGILGLKGRFKGKTCISVAAGPSLNEAWETLKRVQGKIPLIVCDTLVKPMNDRGVVPDFVTALERDPIVAEMFKGQSIPERSMLVGPSLLIPEAFNEFKGRKIAYAASAPYTTNLGLEFLGPFSPGSSAGNLNIALATLMGFSNIIMIGHNLAFAHGSNESHVKGTIDRDRERKRSREEIEKIATGGKVMTQDGLSEVYTIFEYDLFKKQIERAVANNSDKRFINTAAKGNRILGAEYLPLEEALKQCHTEDFDIYPAVLEALKVTDPAMDPKPWRQSLIRFRLEETVDELRKLWDESIAMQASLEKWKDEIAAAELAGTPWSIDELNSKLDQVLKLKVKVVNDKMTLSQSLIGVVGPAHHVFERNINELPYIHQTDYELKKDFLLRHHIYFKIWNKWLEPIYDEHRLAYERVVAKFPLDSEASVQESFNKLSELVGKIFELSKTFSTYSANAPASETADTKSLSIS